MIVKPGLEQHPKFIGLARQVGGDGKAMLILYRLWEHCQNAKKAGLWGKVSPSYVESVARWRGKKGVCWEALRYPLGREEPTKTWVDVDLEGNVTIKGWDEANKQLLASRNNGSLHTGLNRSESSKGQNPRVNRQPTGGATGRLPDDRPTRARGEGGEEIEEIEEREGRPDSPAFSGSGPGGKEKTGGLSSVTFHKTVEEAAAEIPTAQQMFEFFQGQKKDVPLETCRKYAQWHTRGQSWVKRGSLGDLFVRVWREEVPEWAAEDSARPGSDEKPIPQSPQEKLEAIDAELQWRTAEKYPEEHAALVKRRKELAG